MKDIWGDDVEIKDLMRIIEKDSTQTNTTEDEKMDDVFHIDADELTELNSKGIMSERLRLLRELGDGPTVCVTRDCEKMCCNCEMFNRWRICRHIIWMEVLHFAKYPAGDISDAEDDWDTIRETILGIIKDTYICRCVINIVRSKYESIIFTFLRGVPFRVPCYFASIFHG